MSFGGTDPVWPKPFGGTGSVRSALLPLKSVDFSLKRPLTRVCDQLMSDGIGSDVFPFGSVTIAL
jgi:hypothetical protein